MLRIGVMVSGGGTNLQAIIDGISKGTITNTEIAIVVSNNKKAYALERAKQAGIEAVCISPKDYENREQFNQALTDFLDSRRLDLIVVCFRYFVGRLQNHLRPLSVCRGKKCVIERFCKPASVVFVGAGHFLEIGPKRFCGGGVARVVGYRENVDESLVCSVRIAVVEGMSES